MANSGDVIDREKVVKGLEICLKIPGLCNGCPYAKYDSYGKQNRDCVYDLQNDAIELLKEHYIYTHFLHCRDCKYWHDEKARDTRPSWLPCMSVETREDFFCADGERRVDT